MKLRLLAWLMALGLIAQAQSYPVIHPHRPRIYIDSTRFAYLQSNQSTGACGAMFGTFNSAVFSNWYNDPQLYLLGSDSTLWTWDFNSPWEKYQSQFVPFLFKVTGDPTALKRVRFLTSKLNARFDTLNFANYSWYEGEDIIRHFADEGCLLLDWCYDDLPVAMRQHLARNLYRVSRHFMDTYITSSAGNSYVSSHNAWNTFFANQYALTLAGADGLTPLEHDTVQHWYEITLDKWDNGFNPCYSHYRDDDGGWNWTAAYAMWSLVDQFQFFENMRIATGKDYYHDLPWVREAINQYWYFMQPDNWTINWGDGFTKQSADRVMFLHARYFQDPRSQWLAQEWSQPAQIGWTWPRYQILLYKDFNMPVVAKPDPAHDWWSDKTGLSVSRTSWDADAAMVTVYNAPTKKSSHDHRDNNSFTIFKHAPQIVNSGYYASYGDPHYVNYYQRTLAHNSICIFDSTDQYTNWGANVSNDGGQIESVTLMNITDVLSPAAQRGSWVQWASGNDYCYTNSDAHQSYDSTKLTHFRRRVMFHKPDRVVVLDNLHLRNSATQQRDVKWVAHFQQRPTITGTLVTQPVPDHILQYTANGVFQANGAGNVAIRTLLPQGATTTLIGGAGYEFYVDGLNYPVSVAMDTVHTTPGRWRIEVSPPLHGDTVVYLNTIRIGETGAVAVPGGSGWQNPFTIGADWDSTLYFFHAAGVPGQAYHLASSIAGGRTVAFLAADLMASGTFEVRLDGQVVGTVLADTNGIAQGNLVLPSGMHAVELVLVPNAVQQWAGLAPLFEMHPNPASSDVVVNLLRPEAEAFEVVLVNALGQVIQQSKAEGSLTLSLIAWPSGVYFVRVSTGNRSEMQVLLIGR